MKDKKLKGMTLVEIIVALAIFTIMATLLVTACICVTKSVTHTNRMVKKINYQAPAAENVSLDVYDATMAPTGKVDKESTTWNFNISAGGSAYKQVVIQGYTVRKETGDTSSGDFKYFTP